MDDLDGLTSAGRTYDLVAIIGARIYTMGPNQDIHPDGAVLVVDGSILAVLSDSGLARRGVEELTATGRSDSLGLTLAMPPRTVRVVDGAGRMVLPGLVNNHFHESSLSRALQPTLPEHDDRDWPPSPFALGGDMDALSARFAGIGRQSDHLDEQWCRAAALYSLLWQLRGGTTTWADLGSLNQAHVLAQATFDLGIRGMVSRWGADALATNAGDVERLADLDSEMGAVEEAMRAARSIGSPRIRAWPTFLAGFTSTDEHLCGLAAIARAHGSPLGGHFACLDNERAHSVACFGESPVRRFERLGLLDERFVGVHTTHLHAQEVDAVVDSGMSVSHAPSKYGTVGENTNSTAIAPELWRRGVTVTLSTDGNALIDSTMIEAMRAAYLQHNEVNGDHRTCTPHRALAMATIEGARSLGWDDEVGSIEAGKRADLVIVDVSQSCYAEVAHPLTQFLQLGNHRDVRTVIVDGVFLIDEGDLLVVDEERLVGQYRQALGEFRNTRA